MTALLNPRWARCLLPRAVVVIGTVSIAILFSTLRANGQGSPSSPQRTVTLRPLSGTFNEVYVLGFASDLPHPAIVGLAGLTHAGITTLVVIR